VASKPTGSSSIVPEYPHRAKTTFVLLSLYRQLQPSPANCRLRGSGPGDFSAWQPKTQGAINAVWDMYLSNGDLSPHKTQDQML
jgi:hypothetical protein